MAVQTTLHILLLTTQQDHSRHQGRHTHLRCLRPYLQRTDQNGHGEVHRPHRNLAERPADLRRPRKALQPAGTPRRTNADWQAEEVHRLVSEAHQRGARTIAEIIAIPRAEETVQPRFTPSNPIRPPTLENPIPTSAPEHNQMTTPNSTAEPAEASEVAAQKRSSRPQERSILEEQAHQRLTDLRWPNGVRCPKCQSNDITDTPPSASSELRCRKCGKFILSPQQHHRTPDVRIQRQPGNHPQRLLGKTPKSKADERHRHHPHRQIQNAQTPQRSNRALEQTTSPRTQIPDSTRVHVGKHVLGNRRRTRHAETA